MGGEHRPENTGISELIERVRAGETEAREELFQRCRHYLGRLARMQEQTWLRVKVDASDLVQQTMLEAHRDLDGFRGSSQKELFAWLRKILSHNAADLVRRYHGTAKRRARREVRFRDPADSRSLGAPEPAAPGETPSEEFLQIEEELRMIAALDELPPDYQRVIELRNLQRLPFRDVAERMNRSRPAVQMLWMRAIKKLQEVLGDEGSEEV